jgi:hypothetical protein
VSEQLQNFAKTCEEIQRKCCCLSWDAKECARLRYPPKGIGDIEYFDRGQDLEDPDFWCECVCHQEIAEEEASQEWP